MRNCLFLAMHKTKDKEPERKQSVAGSQQSNHAAFLEAKVAAQRQVLKEKIEEEMKPLVKEAMALPYAFTTESCSGHVYTYDEMKKKAERGIEQYGDDPNVSRTYNGKSVSLREYLRLIKPSDGVFRSGFLRMEFEDCPEAMKCLDALGKEFPGRVEVGRPNRVWGTFAVLIRFNESGGLEDWRPLPEVHRLFEENRNERERLLKFLKARAEGL